MCSILPLPFPSQHFQCRSSLPVISPLFLIWSICWINRVILNVGESQSQSLWSAYSDPWAASLIFRTCHSWCWVYTAYISTCFGSQASLGIHQSQNRRDISRYIQTTEFCNVHASWSFTIYQERFFEFFGFRQSSGSIADFSVKMMT